MFQNLGYDRDCHLELALNSNLDRILDSDPDHNPGHNLEIGCDTMLEHACFLQSIWKDFLHFYRPATPTGMHSCGRSVACFTKNIIVVGLLLVNWTTKAHCWLHDT